ncbi:hypothetical protein GCM10009661_19600 [Catellatospora chokoriensis]|uniref:Uncharacterized protein n=1 Tax=Catellatospora chokoriensis TaxID=310353 RepID=A0A8J3K985_9ACTN|nr:hypothetical protein Cch02nite_59370 [Catellatospora chokoriensis]
MTATEPMGYMIPGSTRLQVDGREEVGLMIDSRGMGQGGKFPCYLVLFESTGECAWYLTTHTKRAE